MFYLWWTRGRDPRHQPITVQYDPPDNLTPGEVGTLVDNEAAMRDITATLVDLAVKGYILIEQSEEDQLFGLLHHKNYVFHLKKPATEWNTARPHEIVMLDALFSSGERDTVKLSDLQNHFYTSLPQIRNCIFDGLVTDGYYLHRPDAVRASYVGGGVVIGHTYRGFRRLVGGFARHRSAFRHSQRDSHWTGSCRGRLVHARANHHRGTRLRKSPGSENFLSHVEGDRLDRIVKTPELFEKFLPFAMALHVEKKWVEAFANIAMQPPQWYQGNYSGGFVPYLLVSDLNVMSSSAGSVMTSAPRSSASGSGFGGGGGGGFSGGGFGGGGGGGF